MKRILSILGWTMLVFVVLTVLTAKIESPSDGNNTFGFPLTFFKEYGGKRSYLLPNEFSVWKLLFDISCSVLMVLISGPIFKRLKTRFRKP